MEDFDSYAIITICRGEVHLDMTFNPDAAEPIQIERYASNGWTLCQHCPVLAYAFWSAWSEWNGHMSGGIYLTDNQPPSRVRAIIRSACAKSGGAHAPSEIVTLTDGTYLIRASF